MSFPPCLPLVRIGESPASSVQTGSIASRRAKFFRASLFADPAWDILLFVYSAQSDSKRWR